MKKRDCFISNSTMLITSLVFIGLGVVLFVLFMIFGFGQIKDSPFIISVPFIIAAAILLFAYLIIKFTFKIAFDEDSIYFLKGNVVIDKYKLDNISMKFVNPRYGYVNIECKNNEKTKTYTFEYSKKRGNIIKKYFKKCIENMPDRFSK